MWLYRFQITVINEQYLRRVTRLGADRLLALSLVPPTLARALRDAPLQSWRAPDAAVPAGRCAQDATRWLGERSTGVALVDFGCWLNRTESLAKNIVMKHRNDSDLTRVEMMGLYNALTNNGLDAGGHEPQYSDYTCANHTYQLLKRTAESFHLNELQRRKLSLCDFNVLLWLFKDYMRRGNDHGLSVVGDVIATLLCVKVSSACLHLPADRATRRAYVSLVLEYVFDDVLQWTVHVTVTSAVSDVVVTSCQRRLALGDVAETGDRRHVVAGILQSDDRVTTSPADRVEISLTNCYDATYAKTNFRWTGRPLWETNQCVDWNSCMQICITYAK